jgi:hypothetical protein
MGFHSRSKFTHGAGPASSYRTPAPYDYQVTQPVRYFTLALLFVVMGKLLILNADIGGGDWTCRNRGGIRQPDCIRWPESGRMDGLTS